MEDRCKRCGGNLIPKNDYIYDIDYFMCLQCGNIVFKYDGLGLLHFKFPKTREEKE